MELTVWKSDFGLPSMDIESTQALLYTKIANVPIQVKTGSNPYFTRQGKYPVLKDGNVMHSNLTNLLNYLREHNYGADYSLSNKNCSDSYAFVNMVLLKLKPVLEYVCWCDQRNYDELFAPWFIKNMPIPLNYYYVRQRRNLAKDLIESLYPKAQGIDAIQSFMNNAAIECFSTLATRLGQKDYFYGANPTSLDACVYSYLAPLVKIPFPSKEIPNLLHTWPELIEYVRRIDARFFPDLPGREQVFNQHELFKGVTSEEDFATPITTKLLAFAFVATAMFGFAVSKNIINIDNLKSILSVSPK